MRSFNLNLGWHDFYLMSLILYWHHFSPTLKIDLIEQMISEQCLEVGEGESPVVL